MTCIPELACSRLATLCESICPGLKGVTSQIEYANKTSGDLQSVPQQTSDRDSALVRASQELSRVVQATLNETFFCQGDKADAVFYLQRGRAKLTVVSAKRPQLHFWRLANLWEKSRWRQ